MLTLRRGNPSSNKIIVFLFAVLDVFKMCNCVDSSETFQAQRVRERFITAAFPYYGALISTLSFCFQPSILCMLDTARFQRNAQMFFCCLLNSFFSRTLTWLDSSCSQLPIFTASRRGWLVFTYSTPRA